MAKGNSVDAEIGSTYRELEKTKCQLRKREHDGEMIVGDLRTLADCFDPEKKNSSFREFKDEALSIWDSGAKVMNLPLEAEEIAKDICALQERRDMLGKRLSLLVGCA